MMELIELFRKYRIVVAGILILSGVVASRCVEDPYRSVFLGFSGGIVLVMAGEMFWKARENDKK